MKTIAIIQARMSSSRLPGKSLLPLAGEPLIFHVIRRTQQAKGVDEVVLATSTDETDDGLAAKVNQAGFTVFRGELDDVQKRYYDCAEYYQADLILRVTADNPLVEPELMTDLITHWKATKDDYVACRDCIDGVGSELFTKEAFERAFQMAHDADDAFAKEHVTPPFYQQGDEFKVSRIPVRKYLEPCGLSVTVDTKDHYKTMFRVYAMFYRDGFVSNKEVIKYYKEMKKQLEKQQ